MNGTRVMLPLEPLFVMHLMWQWCHALQSRQLLRGWWASLCGWCPEG